MGSIWSMPFVAIMIICYVVKVIYYLICERYLLALNLLKFEDQVLVIYKFME